MNPKKKRSNYNITIPAFQYETELTALRFVVEELYGNVGIVYRWLVFFLYI